jgi:hypothetical protein
MKRAPMVQIVLWKWEQPGLAYATGYTAEHVNVMCSMLRRNLTGVRHRIICVTDNREGIVECETAPLWSDTSELPNATRSGLPSCYRRLKLYDKATQQSMGIERGDRIVSLDLDALICAPLTPLLKTEGLFVGWALPGKHHPRVFNGSFQMFSAGTLQDIWSDFDPLKSPKEALKAGFLGSDQSWLSYRLIERDGAFGVGWPMIASYPLQVKLQGQHSAQTRIIFYHGLIKPWHEQASETKYPAQYWR